MPLKPTEVVDLAVPSQKIPPTTFQCPHCPRKLRRQSLLTAHLQNYHSTKSTSPPLTVESAPAPKKRKAEPEAERYFSYLTHSQSSFLASRCLQLPSQRDMSSVLSANLAVPRQNACKLSSNALFAGCGLTGHVPRRAQPRQVINPIYLQAHPSQVFRPFPPYHFFPYCSHGFVPSATGDPLDPVSLTGRLRRQKLVE